MPSTMHEEPQLPHSGLQLPIRRMGEGGHSHPRLLLAPSVPDCETDGRETRVGWGLPEPGREADWLPRATPHCGSGPAGNGQEVKQISGKWGDKLNTGGRR